MLSISREVFEFFLDVKFMEDFMTEKVKIMIRLFCNNEKGNLFWNEYFRSRMLEMKIVAAMKNLGSRY